MVNKEIKENCKHSLSICVVCGQEVENKNQKIKELEEGIEKMFTKEQVEGIVLEQRKEIERLNDENRLLLGFKPIAEKFKSMLVEKDKECHILHGKLLQAEVMRDKWFREKNILFDKTEELKSQFQEQTEKIKELEKDRDDLWGKGGELLSENIELKGLLKDSQKEIEIEQTEKFKSRNWASSLLDEQNKLESQLQEQRNKIKERIEELSKKKYHYVIKITDDKGIELKKSIKEYHKAGTLDWCENCKAIEELKSLLGEKE